MSQIEKTVTVDRVRREMSRRVAIREPVVVIVEDAPVWSDAIRELCEFLSVTVFHLRGGEDLIDVLRTHNPMGVLAGMESSEQDGCHVLKVIAAHDPELPVFVLTGGDAAMAGAAEAVEEVWGLTSLRLAEELPAPGAIVEFLCYAGQRGRCLGLMPA